jgi:hypothetical protein
MHCALITVAVLQLVEQTIHKIVTDFYAFQTVHLKKKKYMYFKHRVRHQ